MRTERITCALGTPARWSGDYLIALIPVYCWGVFAFGAGQTHLQLTCSVLASIVFVLAMQLINRHKIVPYHYLIAFVFGMVLGFLMPAGAPMWYAILSAFLMGTVWYLPRVGIYARKYVHPIAFALSVMGLIFPSFSVGEGSLLISADRTQGVYDLLLGRHSGRIGEISILMILIGGAYLVLRRVIDWQPGVSMLATVALLSYLFPASGVRTEYMLAQLLTGGTVFASVYLLPICSFRLSGRVKWVYGVLTGVLTFLFCRFVPNLDGVYPAILLATAAVRLLDERVTENIRIWQSEF